MLLKDEVFSTKKIKFSSSDRAVLLNASVFRNSPLQIFHKMGVLKDFAKFTEKHLCQSLCLNKFTGLQVGILLRKGVRDRCFPVKIVKFLRTPIL